MNFNRFIVLRKIDLKTTMSVGRPSWCIVPGCTLYKQSKAEGAIFHSFPLKDVERCRKWLMAIGHAKYGVDTAVDRMKSLRVCSKHFTDDDYKRDLQAELLKIKGRRKLKDTAVPSVFPWTEANVKKASGKKIKKQSAEVTLKFISRGPDISCVEKVWPREIT